MYQSYWFAWYVKCVFCHYGIARPQIVKPSRYTNILNKQSRNADKRLLCSSGLEWGLTAWKASTLECVTQGLGLAIVDKVMKFSWTLCTSSPAELTTTTYSRSTLLYLISYWFVNFTSVHINIFPLSPVFESSIANENINENLGDVGEMAPPKILTPPFFFQTYKLSASVHTGISVKSYKQSEMLRRIKLPLFLPGKDKSNCRPLSSNFVIYQVARSCKCNCRHSILN